jgi:hypothetical protein
MALHFNMLVAPVPESVTNRSRNAKKAPVPRCKLPDLLLIAHFLFFLRVFNQSWHPWNSSFSP